MTAEPPTVLNDPSLINLVKLLTAPIPADEDTSTTCQTLQTALTEYLTEKNLESTHLDLLSTFVPIRPHIENIYDGLGLAPNVSDDTLAKRVNQIRRLYTAEEYEPIRAEADLLGKRAAPDEEGPWEVSARKRVKYDMNLAKNLMKEMVTNTIARKVAEGLMGELTELAFKSASFEDEFNTVTEVQTEVRRLEGSAGTARLLAVWVAHRAYLHIVAEEGMEEYKAQFLTAGGTKEQLKYWLLKHQHLDNLREAIGIYPLFLPLDGLWAKVGEGPLKEVVDWWESPKRPTVPMEKYKEDLTGIWNGFSDHMFPKEAIERLEKKVRPSLKRIMQALPAELGNAEN